MFIPDDLVREVLSEFESSLQLIQLDEEAQRTMYLTETIRRVGGVRWTTRYFAVRHGFTLPATELANDQDPMRRRANERIEQVLHCLRLFKRGHLYLGGIIQRRVPNAGSVAVFHLPWTDGGVPFYPLESAAELDELAAFWQRLASQAVRSREYLLLATRWFSASRETVRIEDRIVWLMTAAEALFGPGMPDNRKGQYIANSIRDLGTASVDGEDVYNHVLGAYQLRNTVLHDGHPRQWLQCRRMHDEDLYGFVELASEYVRAAIRAMIYCCTGSGTTTP